MRTFVFHTSRRRRGGFTLVEVLVALAIVALLTSFVFTTFSTLSESVATGEARQEVMQNTRTALELMSREIASAMLDSRNRDFVFVCADGLNSLPNARIQLQQSAIPGDKIAVTYGLGNAQYPLGLDPTENTSSTTGPYGPYLQVYDLYRGPLGTQRGTIISIKPNANRLPIGPPDRLDFIGLAANVGGFTTAVGAQPAELRYMIATDAFFDGEDNDGDGTVDDADSTLPRGAPNVWTGTGDVLLLNLRNANRLSDVAKLGLYRAVDTSPDSNPFSNRPLPNPVTIGAWTDPDGRYPWKDADELVLGASGELIGRYIYDLQFEFYGRIAVRLDDATDGVDNDGDGVTDEADEDGYPNAWGIGWGFQDARGEDIGTDRDATVIDTDGSQSNGLLDADPDGAGPLTSEGDLGTDGVVDDPWDLAPITGPSHGMPDNISNNDGVTAEASIGEGNGRLDSRVMGIWDSRSPDPRNPLRASELDRVDTDNDLATLQGDTIDNDADGANDAGDTGTTAFAIPESDADADDAISAGDDFRLLFDATDDGTDGWIDDRGYEPPGRAEGVDEGDEATQTDDRLPRAIRITIVARDSGNVLEPVVMSTTVWLAPGG